MQFDLIPAIDLKDGACVRLKQGLMDQATEFSTNPVEVAGRWARAGAKRIHLVDLNGAFEGEPVHFEIVKAICEAYPDIEFQIGGGIRKAKTLKAYFDAGVKYQIIGTAAIKNPRFLTTQANANPGQIILGLDAKDGYVATEGWGDVSEVQVQSLIEKFSKLPLAAIIYTDISKDGMMQGPNVEATQALADNCPFPVIASGGVSQLSDIKNLLATKSIKGAIVGRAIYEGDINLTEALELIH